METFRHSVALNGNPEPRQSVALNSNPGNSQHGSGSNASGGPVGLSDTRRCGATQGRFPVASAKGSPGPQDKPLKRGAPVRRADMGDVQAVEAELYAALLPANPRVGVEIMAKVGNSYKKRLKVSN